MIAFDVPLIPVLQLVLGVVLPVLVGLVTTRATSAGRKAVLLAALSVVTSLLTELIAALQSEAVYNLGLALILGLGTFIVAVATHYGLLKPTGVSAAALAVGNASGPGAETTARGNARGTVVVHGAPSPDDLAEAIARRLSPSGSYNGIPNATSLQNWQPAAGQDDDSPKHRA